MQPEKEKMEIGIREKYLALKFYLNERTIRIWAATEIKQIGKGGISIVKIATGLDYKTLHKGLSELEKKEEERLSSEHIRNEGGGRKKTLKRTKH